MRTRTLANLTPLMNPIDALHVKKEYYTTTSSHVFPEDMPLVSYTSHGALTPPRQSRLVSRILKADAVVKYYLGCEVEPQVAVALKAVLDQEGDLVGEAQLDRFGHAACLAEVDQILQREGKGHGLGQINLDVV